MNVTVRRVRQEEWPALDQLAQYYAYDFSEILGVDVAEGGRFDSITLGEFSDPDRQAFFFEVEGNLAGFALVHNGSYVTGAADVSDMEEFFVMRKYRRQGVGSEAARRLFDMFPGRWEVRELVPNVAAQEFWRRVIGEYTNGEYDEQVLDDERWHGPVQSFTAMKRAHVR